MALQCVFCAAELFADCLVCKNFIMIYLIKDFNPMSFIILLIFVRLLNSVPFSTSQDTSLIILLFAVSVSAVDF